MFAARIVYSGNQVVENRAGRRHHLGWRYARNRDAVLIDFLRQPLAEAFQSGLLRAVARAAGVGWRVRVRTSAGPYRRAGRDVDDAAAAIHHVAHRQLAQNERRVEVDRPRPHPAAERIVLDRNEVRQRGVVDQYVHAAVGGVRLLEQPLAVLRQRYVYRRRRSLAARLADVRHRLLQRTFQRVVALAQRPRRRHHAAALSREQPRDLRADAPTRARYHAYLAIQLAHNSTSVCIRYKVGRIILGFGRIC